MINNVLKFPERKKCAGVIPAQKNETPMVSVNFQVLVHFINHTDGQADGQADKKTQVGYMGKPVDDSGFKLNDFCGACRSSTGSVLIDLQLYCLNCVSNCLYENRAVLEKFKLKAQE